MNASAERDMDNYNNFVSAPPAQSIRLENEWDFLNLTSNIQLKQCGLENAAIEVESRKEEIKSYVQKLNRDHTKTHSMRDLVFGQKLLTTIDSLIKSNETKMYALNDQIMSTESAIKKSQSLENSTEAFQITRYSQLNFKSIDFMNLIKEGDIMAAKAVLLDPVIKYTVKGVDGMTEMAKDLLARHSLGEKGFAEYKANLVKRERLIDLVTDLERRAKKISQKVMQIQSYIVD